MLERSPNQATRIDAPARFVLDGLNKTVTARIAHQDDAGLTLRQELPFLQLHRTVRDASGRSASLMDVGVTLCDGMPHLVLELRYNDRDDPTKTVELDTSWHQQRVLDSQRDDLSFEDEPTTEFRIVRRRDSTVPYRLEADSGNTEIVIAGAPAASPVPYAGRQRAWLSDLWHSVSSFFRNN